MQTPFSEATARQPSPGADEQTSRSLHSDNLFSAYKTLKEQEEHLINMKNRIQKLQQTQLKTLQKCQNQSRVLLSLEKIRQQKSQEQHKIQQHKITIRNSMESQHQRNHYEKQSHKKNLQTVLSDIKNKRNSNYEFMKLKKQQNETRLIKLRELDLEDKKRIRNKVVEEEKLMRESKMVKIKAKKENICKSNQREIHEIEEKYKQQGAEIQKLARLEVELLEKHSESQAKQSRVKEKYEEFIKNQNDAVKQMRKKQEVESVYVHPLVKRIEKRIDKYNIKNAR